MFPLERFWEDGNNSRKSKVWRNLNFVAELSPYPSPNHHTHRHCLFRNIFQRCGVDIIKEGDQKRKKEKVLWGTQVSHPKGILIAKGQARSSLPSLPCSLGLPLTSALCTLCYGEQRASLAEAQSCGCVQMSSLHDLHQCWEQPSGLKNRELWLVHQIKATRELQTRYWHEVKRKQVIVL